MARWEPNAPERLAQAALELFAERGYENTTVLDIAQRAGLAKSTFFRHFQDKREVLFREDALTGPLLAAIAASPAGAAPLEALARGLDALGLHVLKPERRDMAIRRRAVIDANLDLREREALKGVSLTAAIVRALEDRGASDLAATVAAELGALALQISYERWSDPAATADFGEIAAQAMDEVRAAASSL